MPRISLSTLSIVFSVKIDSEDRLNNLMKNLDFHSRFFFDYEIIIVEQDSESKLDKILKNIQNVKHFFYPSDGCHHKTKNLNLATSLASRDIVMMLDVDIIYSPAAILEALVEFQNGADFVAPYNGIVVDLKKKFLEKTTDISEIFNRNIFLPVNYDIYKADLDFSEIQPLYGGSSYLSTGACLIYKKEAFYKIGGWNPNFISYGFEDREFVYRIEKFNYRLLRLPLFNIYHFEHDRMADSFYNSFLEINECEWQRVIDFTLPQLTKYVHNGFKQLVFSTNLNFEFINNIDRYDLKVSNCLKHDLSELSVIVPLLMRDKGLLPELNLFVEYFDKFFIGYEILMVEMEYRNCKYLKSTKNTKYYWLGTGAFDMEIVLGKGKAVSTKKILAIWDFLSLVEPELLLESYKNTMDNSEHIHLNDENWFLEGHKKKFKGNGVSLSTKF